MRSAFHFSEFAALDRLDIANTAGALHDKVKADVVERAEKQ
jgi:hypothetical protein